MIILNTNLTKDDYEFASIYLKILIYTRDKKDTKDFEKFVTPLAEKGQVEAMEYYCRHLSPTAALNTKIVLKFRDLENKNRKEPRDFLALSAFYNWFIDAYRFNYKTDNVEHLEAFVKSKEYQNFAFQGLARLKSIDPIASEYFFRMSPHESYDEEYYRHLSNSRNQIFSSANHQINDAMKLKLLHAYATNVIQFASDSEYNLKMPILSKINSDLQKSVFAAHEFRRKV